MSGVKGDFVRLKQLATSLRKASKTARNDVLRVFAADVAYRVDRCFLRSENPYGGRWEPLKAETGRRAGGKPLLDTGRLRNSIHARAIQGGVRVSSNVVYAAIQNYGGTITRAARTELRRYAVTKSDRRRRIGLYSRNARSVGKHASIREGQTELPARQYLPSEDYGLPDSWVAQLRIRADQIQRQLGLL